MSDRQQKSKDRAVLGGVPVGGRSANTIHGTEPPHGDAFQVVGTRVAKVDGIDLATGRGQFTDDIALPGMLHAKFLRSPHPHARITKIDTTAAEALPGVHAVLIGTDLPERYGVIPWTPDETALAVDKVRFVGDGVACVAAVDEDTANAACALVTVDYELLRPWFDPETAAEHGEDPPIHEDAKHGNVSKHVELEFGEVDAGLSAAAHTVEGDFSFHGTAHTPIEPHCAVAHWDGERLTLWSATQIPHYVHKTVAKVMDLKASQVRVIQPYLGGAFGGKSDPFGHELCVAELARRTGRPVKALLTREEGFYLHRGRHPMDMHFRAGCGEDGRLTAVDSKILIDGGAYSSFGLVTTYYSGQLLTGPYCFPSYRFDSTRVFTNKPPCGPKRGHGSVQPRFAIEIQMDELAEQCGMDPIDFRRVNFVGSDVTTVNGQRITSNGFLECLDRVEEASGWAERRGRLGPGRGLGVAGSMYISGTNYAIYPNDMPQAGIQIRLDRSGIATVYSGASEIGQGSTSMAAMIVAEELGIPLDCVRMVVSDTDLTPVDLGAYSSRITFMLGNACVDAARKLRRQIQEAVADEWGIKPGRVFLGGGEVFDSENPDARSITHVEAFELAEGRFETLGATGSYNTPDLGGDYRGGTIGASPAYSFTAHVVEVEVDGDTGEIRVPKAWVAHDCGRAISPVNVEGQCEGSTYMGIAEALTEHHEVYTEGPAAGLLKRPNLLDYTIPTTMDTPEIETLIVESLDPEGPYGAKEAGEGPLHGSIPALANAIHDAVGVRLRILPFTPDVVLAAIREKEEGA